MTRSLRLLPLLLAFTAASLAQTATPTPKPAKTAAPKTPYYIDPAALNLPSIISDPPAANSPQAQAELSQLHQIEQSRTPAEVASAKADEALEDIFSYKNILGPSFTPEGFPITSALGDHVKNEQSVAGAALKALFKRPRPYQLDKTLHPVCDLTEAPNSYPSGHALTGYLEAFTLAELLPEKRSAILTRADDYAHNRLVCGVHYPSDLEASRRVAYVVFGDMLASPKFQQDLAAARAELQAKFPTTH